MPESANTSVLGRMLGKPVNPLEQLDMSPAKALQLAVTRGSERLAGLSANVSAFSEEQLSLADIVRALEEPHIIHRTKGPGGAEGLALWDAAAISALSEHMITGRMMSAPAGARQPTPTDAAVVNGLLCKILELFDQGLAQVDDVPPVRGFRPMAVFKDGRAVSMAFDEMSYRKYLISLDLGNGARTGTLSLIFPWQQMNSASAESGSGSKWKRDWHRNVNDSCVPVEAILHNISMPIHEIEKMKVGSLIPVPIETIAKVSVKGTDGRSVAVGRLGQCNGFRAVRIAIGSPMVNPKPSEFSAAKPSSGVQKLSSFETSTSPAEEPGLQNSDFAISETTQPSDTISATD